MADFRNKVAVVTGAAGGLGRIAALAFAGEGAKVVFNDINQKGGEETLALIRQTGGEGVFLPGDVSREADAETLVRTAAERFGRLDCAVNNAGIEILGPIAEQTEANWNRVMDVNGKGVFLGVKHQVRQMLKNGGGSIVIQSSVTSDITGNPTSGLYAASKAAEVGLMKCVALEVAPHNININCIAACGIDAPGSMFSEYMKIKGIPPAEMMKRFPMGRFGKPEELAAAVLFLCSEPARFITGHTLVIDGGFTVG
jgi:NAD(P)-dependent dehydrogenase (short-subunit alcohol dehydrogenase family)